MTRQLEYWDIPRAAIQLRGRHRRCVHAVDRQAGIHCSYILLRIEVRSVQVDLRGARGHVTVNAGVWLGAKRTYYSLVLGELNHLRLNHAIIFIHIFV